MTKKKIAAVLSALILAAASSGCGAKKINEAPAHSSGKDSSAQSSQAGDGSSAGDTAANADSSSQASAAPSGGAKDMTPVVKYIKRAEEPAYTPGEDVKKPPEGSGELHLLISMDPHTNYVRAAEEYLSLGGKIKVIKTPRDALFDQISAENVAGKKIDIAQFDNGMMFPYGVTQGVIQATDTAIDFTADRWSECRELSEAFEMNGWHYAAIFGVNAKTALFYNKNTLSSNGFADPKKLYDSGEWTTERFCDIIRKWHDLGGKCGVAGLDYEEGLCIGTGRALITYDRACTGFSNNFYDASICSVMNYIYGLKYDGIVGNTGAYDIASAFAEGTLFWSGTYEEGNSYSGSDLAAVPFPTLNGDKSSWCAEYDGLVLLSGAEDLDAARAFFECARDQEHELSGKFTDVFEPEGKALYEYGMGISPMVSDSMSGANAGYDKAIIPMMYTEGPSIGEWDNVMCYTFTKEIIRELANENNAIADKVFGRSKEKETKKPKKTKKTDGE